MYGELKVKKRYLLCRVRISSGSITASQLYSVIMNKLCELYGWNGKAVTSLKTWQIKDRQNYFILKCSLRGLPYLLITTTLVNKLNNEWIAIDVLRISGTIKALLR